MFDLALIEQVMSTSSFIDDFARVRQGLALHRVGQVELFDMDLDARLSYFVESVLASAPDWKDSNGATDACRIAGEIAELLSFRAESESTQRRFRIRAALLYELADLPAIAAVVLEREDYSRPLGDFFARRGLFGHLNALEATINIGEPSTRSLVESALYSDLRSLAAYEQGMSDDSDSRGVDLLESLSKDFALECTASETAAWKSVLKKRDSVAVRRYVPSGMMSQLRSMRFPPELWSTQVEAIAAGLLDSRFDAWGLAAPTGTGKTFIARLLITDTLNNNPDSIVLYLVPSRALVYEISTNLDAALRPLGYDVTAVTPQLVALNAEESESLAQSSVLVLTPEKADLLLRLGAEILSRVSLVVVDEAHHIESATRGILLEMYLWRIKRALQGRGRFVFLSAVAPNIHDLVAWMGSNPGSKVIDRRATRMRVGVYRIRGTGKKAAGEIRYSDGTVVDVIDNGAESTKGRALIQLAVGISIAGPVLIVAKGKKECERLAKTMREWLSAKKIDSALSDEALHSDIVQRLDARLEREMYPEVTLRSLVANRIAYHHAGLPPSVRIGLEDAIRKGVIDYVFATTTLADGVNFPFSTVIVQSLALRAAPEKGQPVRYHPVTPRVFWNIAGRAGRPGHDREGQVILFEPSLGLDKIAYVIGDYMNSKLSSIEPVRSALAHSIREIQEAIQNEQLSSRDIEELRLPVKASARVQGAINLLRVSLLHARASRFEESPEEIYESTFAARFLSDSEDAFAKSLFQSQDNVVLEFLTTPDAPSPNLIAELGLSIETLTDLREWVQSLETWQIENFSHLLYGGEVNKEQAKYVVGPVAKRMSELEGPKLGGFLSEVILLWLSGVPFSTIWRSRNQYWRTTRIEDLISSIYSRVQYLLPWGLYAADRLVESEARRRNVVYENQIRSLAYLADAGVPSLDALRLVSLDFERTDATRLAGRYKGSGGLGTGTDVVTWLVTQPLNSLVACVRGKEQRRVDFDFENRVRELRTE